VKLNGVETMTILPATLDEAQALDLVRKFFAMLGGVDSLLTTPGISQAFFVLQSTAQNPLQSGAEKRMMLIAAAKAGDPDAVDLLKSFLLDCDSQNIELTTELKEYRMWIIANGIKPHRRSEARPYILRNVCIVTAVALVLDRFPNIKATGNSPRRRCACAIVAEVLGMDYDSVLKLWKPHKKDAPSVPGWSLTMAL
jgi:hypothetical protein